MSAARLITAVLAVLSVLPCLAQPPELPEITTEKVGEDLYVLFGRGGNILASIGDQGVLIVDDQFPELAIKYRATIRELGGGAIDFVVNSHWHYDHADGNKVLGPEGSWIISQANSRDMMTKDNTINTVLRPPVDQPAYPPPALPIATFEERMQLHFNGERIDLLHYGPAHTTGDTATVFRGHNAVHMGDVYNNSGYPFIDADNGGSLDGIIEFCTAVLKEIDEDTVVVPGHGPVATYKDMEEYVAMLTTIRDRLAKLIAKGASLLEVVAAEPTADWDDAKGDPTRLLDRAYASMTR